MGTGHQREETTEETTEAITSADDKIPTAIKETARRVTSKATRLSQQTNRTPVSNAEKWDTSLGTVLNADKEGNITEPLISSTLTMAKDSLKQKPSKKTPSKPSKPNSTPYPRRIEKNLPWRWAEGTDRIFPQPN